MTQTLESILPILTKESLIIKVESLVRTEEMTYLEAIMHICEESNIDPEDMARMVDGPLKAKLEAEAKRNNNLPRDSNTFTLE